MKINLYKVVLLLTNKILISLGLGLIILPQAYGAFFQETEAQEIRRNIKAIQEEIKNASERDYQTLLKELEEQYQALEELKSASSIDAPLRIQADGTLFQIQLPEPPMNPDMAFRKRIRELYEAKSPIAQNPKVDLWGIYRKGYLLSWPFVHQLKQVYEDEGGGFLKEVEKLCEVKEERLKKEFSETFESFKKECKDVDSLDSHVLEELEDLIDGWKIRTLNQSLFKEIINLLEQLDPPKGIKEKRVIFDPIIYQMAQFAGSVKPCKKTIFLSKTCKRVEALRKLVNETTLDPVKNNKNKILEAIKGKEFSLQFFEYFPNLQKRKSFDNKEECDKNEKERNLKYNFIKDLEDLCAKKWKDLKEEFFMILTELDPLLPCSGQIFLYQIQELEGYGFLEQIKNKESYREPFKYMVSLTEKILAQDSSHYQTFSDFFTKMTNYTGIELYELSDD